MHCSTGAIRCWSQRLIQAFLASVLLILVPVGRSGARRALPTAPVALYFLAIGLAFMFMEIAFIQKFVLFLAHPLVCGGSCVMRIPGFRRCWKLAGWAMAEVTKDPQQLPGRWV